MLKKYKAQAYYVEAIQFDGTIEQADKLLETYKTHIQVHVSKSWDRNNKKVHTEVTVSAFIYQHECWNDVGKGDYIIVNDNELTVYPQKEFEYNFVVDSTEGEEE